MPPSLSVLVEDRYDVEDEANVEGMGDVEHRVEVREKNHQQLLEDEDVLIGFGTPGGPPEDVQGHSDEAESDDIVGSHAGVKRSSRRRSTRLSKKVRIGYPK